MEATPGLFLTPSGLGFWGQTPHCKAQCTRHPGVVQKKPGSGVLRILGLSVDWIDPGVFAYIGAGQRVGLPEVAGK